MAFEKEWEEFQAQMPRENESEGNALVATRPAPPALREEGEIYQRGLTGEDEMLLLKVMESIMLPVAADRSSIPGHLSLLETFGGLDIVRPEFDLEYINVIENLARVNPEISNAVENLLMANTRRKIFFPDSVADSQQKLMVDHLKRRRDDYYKYSYGAHGLTNDILGQLATAGAASLEAVPNKNLTGIDYVCLVSPKWIYFNYDRATGNYEPMQRVPRNSIFFIPTANLIQGIYKKLNPATYKYFAMRRLGDSPYPVPPFLAALEDILIQKDMITNLKVIVGKLGLLGFLKVLFNKPIIKPGESADGYRSRLTSMLREQVDEIKKGFKTGFLASYSNQSTAGIGGAANTGGMNQDAGINNIEMQSTTTNATGAEKIVTLVNDRVFLGLKQDSAMHGQGTRVTETFGRVILAKMTTQFGGYQKVLENVWNWLDLLELTLAGFQVPYVESEYEAVMIGDALKDAQAEQNEILNQDLLYNQGVINQQQRANNLGYEEPDLEEPRMPTPGPGGIPPDKTAPPGNPAGEKKTTAESNSWEVELALLGGVKPEFEYCSDKLCSGHSHDSGHEIILSLAGGEEKFWKDYISESERIYLEAAAKTAANVGKELAKLGQGVSQQTVESLVMYQLYLKWDATYIKKQRKIIKKFVNEAYDYFRIDPSPLKGMADIPDPVFNLIDLRAKEFFAASDELYLGKFITDADTRKRITGWIKTQYLDNALPIGQGSPGIDKFKEEFAGVLGGEDYKIRRVIDTTVNRIHNTAAISYIQQAGVQNFIITTVNDKLRCPYCAALQGRKFRTEIEYEKITKLVKSQPEAVVQLSPFVVSSGLTPDNIEKMSERQIQDYGIGAPPYHPHCRCTVVADL